MKQVILLACLLSMFGCTDSGTDDAGKAGVKAVVKKEASVTAVETARLNSWLDQEFAGYLDFHPLARTRLGDKTDYDKLDDVSDAMADKILAWRRASVAEMKSTFNRDSLDSQGKISYDLWLYLLDREEAGLPFRDHQYIFGRRGPHTSLPNNLINYHKVDNLSDARAYISRLNASNRYLLQYLKRAKDSAAMGIRAPYFDYEIAMSQTKRVINGAPFTDQGESALWQDFNKKIEGLLSDSLITEKQATELIAQGQEAMLLSMKPAYDEILAWLESDIKETGGIALGASELPNGKAYYDYRLSLMTTLPLGAKEIHETGLAEVARIREEMKAIMRRVSFEGSLDEFFAFTRSDDQFYFPNTDEGRAGYLALANKHLDQMKAKLPDYFGILPKAGLEVRRVEAYREQAGAAAHYMRGTKDGSRPGVFYAHLIDMSAMSNFRLEDLSYHEGLPGHHMQISIQQELEDIPRFRTYHGYTAFSEGWALYAEYLGKDMGFYEDAYADFGRLSGEMWRAIRLVVDTGIHAMNWTEEESIAYALANSPRPESSVRSEVRRYFNNPAQATAYKIGMLKILELRRRAQEELGDKFDYRGFHDRVLGGGSLPLPILESQVDAWIQGVKTESG